MPIVEYKCEEHGNFDIFHHYDDEYGAICPECKKEGKRVWSPFSFTFDFKYGWDVGLGEYVDTKKQREELCRDKGLSRIKD